MHLDQLPDIACNAVYTPQHRLFSAVPAATSFAFLRMFRKRDQNQLTSIPSIHRRPWNPKSAALLPLISITNGKMINL
jgi:hypothetical protein